MNKSGKNESIGGVFRDAPRGGAGSGESNRRSQADLGPPFCDNGREGVCLSDWLIYGLLSSWTSFYRLFACTLTALSSHPATFPFTPSPNPTTPTHSEHPPLRSRRSLLRTQLVDSTDCTHSSQHLRMVLTLQLRTIDSEEGAFLFEEHFFYCVVK